MLENDGLLLQSWIDLSAVPSAHLDLARKSPARSICDPDSGSFLGFVRPRLSPSDGWLPWRSRQIFDIFETEDASLLLTLHSPRLLSWTWEVRDAEESRVGFLCRDALLDRQGLQFGKTCSSRYRKRGSFVSRHGMQLAAFEIDDDQCLLIFDESVVGLPFVRMILLAAALTVLEEHSDVRLRQVG